MPRSVKGSEDELEMKIGRRTRAIVGASNVDSPLRRSTRNKQPVCQDDGSLPESIASDASAPPAKSTRRRTTAVDNSITEKTICLRPRRNSTASDTVEISDNDASGDIKKRITTRSVTASPSIETPSKTRLRRNSRAGSESKTMSPSVRTTRRTRASSIDLEDLNVQSTPRKCMSALPSELSVIKEVDSLVKESPKHNDTEITNISNNSPINSIKSPMSRLDANENKINLEMIEEMSTGESILLHNDVLENSLNNPSTSSKKRRSSGNKNNKQSNETMPIKQSKSITPQRNSVNTTINTTIQVEERLNKSVDAHLLTTDESQSLSTLQSASKQPETTNNNKSFDKQNFLPSADDSKDETIYLESAFEQELAKKTKNASENFQEIDSEVVKTDSTNNSLVFHDTKNFNDSINMNSSRLKSLTVNEDHGNLDSAKIHVSENMVEHSHDSFSLSKESTDENAQFNKSVVEIVDEDDNENSKNITAESHTNVVEIRRLSIVKSQANNEENEEINPAKRRSSSTGSASKSKRSQTRKSQSKTEKARHELSIGGTEDMEIDIKDIFQDIPADEWEAKQTKSSENDGNNEDNLKHEYKNNQSILSSDDESWNKNNSITQKITSVADNSSNATINKLTKKNSRKSLNTESVKPKSDSKLKRRTIAKIDTTKSCIKPESISNKNTSIDNSQVENDDQNEMECSIKSLVDPKQQSSIEQTHDRTPVEHLMDEGTNEDKTIFANKSSHNTSKSGSDATDDNSANINFSHIANDPDFKRLVHSMYPNSNIPGDVRQATKTETSEDDDDDNDNDDGNDIKEEESDRENKEKIMKSSTQDIHETYKNDNENSISLKLKSKIVNSSSSNENVCDMEQNRSLNTMETSITPKKKSKKLNSIVAIDTSTPKIQRRSSGSTVPTLQKLSSTETTTDLKTSTLNESQSKVELMHVSTYSNVTPNEVDDSNVQNTRTKKSNVKTEKTIGDSRKSQMKGTCDTPLNHSMQIASTINPEVTHLMKEKLSESFPTLKSQRRSLNASNTLLSSQETVPKIKKDKKQKVRVLDDVHTDIEKTDKESKKLMELSTLTMESPKLSHAIKENENSNSTELTKENKRDPELLKLKEKCSEKSVEISDPLKKSSIKRLPADILENLPDVPMKKRQNIEQMHIHSKTKRDLKKPQSSNCSAEDVGHVSASTSDSTTKFKVLSLDNTFAKLQNLPDNQVKMQKQKKIKHLFAPSSFSSTTHFDVISLKKRTKERTEKTAAAFSFRERMLARNKRQPVSAYLVYQQKREASR